MKINIRTYLARIKKRIFILSLKIFDKIANTDTYLRYKFYISGYYNSNYKFNKNEIGFLHLPKTGGTSFFHILNECESHGVINLNIHRPISKYCDPKEYKYITIMRNPIDRVWSHYQMVLRNNSIDSPYKKYSYNGLRYFLKKTWLTHDLNCQFLSGDMGIKPNEKTLNNAISNLKNMYAVFDFKNFTRDVSVFLNQHKIPFEEIPNKRKSVYPKPTSEEVKLISDYNQLDIALFDYWKRIQDNSI